MSFWVEYFKARNKDLITFALGRTVVLLQLYQLSNTIQGKLAYKSLYIISIRAMKMRLSKLQDDDKKTGKLRL